MSKVDYFTIAYSKIDNAKLQYEADYLIEHYHESKPDMLDALFTLSLEYEKRNLDNSKILSFLEKHSKQKS